MKQQTALFRTVGVSCICIAVAMFEMTAGAQSTEPSSTQYVPPTTAATARIVPSSLKSDVKGVQITLPPLPVTVAVVTANPPAKKTLAVAGKQEVSLTGANSKTATVVGMGLALVGAGLVIGARRRKPKLP